MNGFLLRLLIVLGLLGALLLFGGPIWAQSTNSGISARDRYSGPLGAPRDDRARLATAQRAAGPVVNYQEIGLRPGLRVTGSTGPAPAAAEAIAALPLKAKGGFLIYELRAGKLTTIINGNRQERRLGEFWIVGPTDMVTLETADDSVVVQTIQLPGQ